MPFSSFPSWEVTEIKLMDTQVQRYHKIGTSESDKQKADFASSARCRHIWLTLAHNGVIGIVLKKHYLCKCK